MAGWLSDREMAMWEAYVLASFNLFSVLDAELKRDFDITHLDYGILSRLSLADGDGRRMSDLAETFGVDRSVVTYRIKRMEGRGWVRRTDCPTDGRGVVAVLTNKGRSLLEAAAPAHVESVRRMFLDHLRDEDLPTLARVFDEVRRLQATETTVRS